MTVHSPNTTTLATVKGTLREAVNFATAELDAAAAREAQLSLTVQRLEGGVGGGRAAAHSARAKFVALENEAARLTSVTKTLIAQRDEARAQISGPRFDAAVAQRVEQFVEGQLKEEIARQVRVHSSRAVKGVLALEIAQRIGGNTAASDGGILGDASVVWQDQAAGGFSPSGGSQSGLAVGSVTVGGDSGSTVGGSAGGGAASAASAASPRHRHRGPGHQHSFTSDGEMKAREEIILNLADSSPVDAGGATLLELKQRIEQHVDDAALFQVCVCVLACVAHCGCGAV